ncbi:TRAP-type C4-dicarboxylate transport system, large permease component [Olavius algarvensis Delta 1 endosymbiont]|nr:TRAP-type C4-dicarboxylate transport system, large permease component [Olavius algarvensis Delta 1 endosymbiont]
MVWIVAILALLFLISGAALAYVVGAATVMIFIASDNIRYLAVLPQRIFSQLDVFALMAMVLFIMTGEVMNRTGVTRYLIDFSMSLVGRFKGGLGHVNILTSIFFAGVSGSAVADAAALSNTLIPAMREQGYRNRYAGAVTAASSVIGPIIPPSIILIFYGAWMQVSIGGLFAAGILPGLLLGMALMLANAIFAHRQDHPGGRGTPVPPLGSSFVKSIPALMLPSIILGGIVFGIATPTEAAGVAVAAALVAGFFYGGVSFKIVWGCIERTAILTGSIFMVLAAAACAAYVGSLEQWPQQIARLATESGVSGITFLLLINLIFLIAGMFMDVPMALALLVPLFGPAAVAQGVDPIHLGIILCLNLTMGLITPPLGGCLIVVSAISGENYWKYPIPTWPRPAVWIPPSSVFISRFCSRPWIIFFAPWKTRNCLLKSMPESSNRGCG